MEKKKIIKNNFKQTLQIIQIFIIHFFSNLIIRLIGKSDGRRCKLISLQNFAKFTTNSNSSNIVHKNIAVIKIKTTLGKLFSKCELLGKYNNKNISKNF